MTKNKENKIFIHLEELIPKSALPGQLFKYFLADKEKTKKKICCNLKRVVRSRENERKYLLWPILFWQ
tara:strand:+ start:301 stop:504 length:204 start_codon:yes stop_codon:yes gene_type:complete